LEKQPFGAKPTQDRRITTLDGLRGLMTIMVIVSHYFAELEHGFRGVMVGWIAVDMFFVLSGFLIGKLILDRKHHSNFFTVFYIRRICRIIPPYLFTIILVSLLIRWLPQTWVDANVQFPLWSYLTFNQGFFMAAVHSIGAHWLAPTWTLAVEEHFYLIVPAALVFTPSRWLIPSLISITVASFSLRLGLFCLGGNTYIALGLLPGQAAPLACGLLAAIAVRTDGVNWPRITPALRITPILGVGACALLHSLSLALFNGFDSLLVAIACTAYLLCIVHETPEARRYHSKTLQFFGNNGYCLYLCHLPILGIMHGIILGTKPDLATPAQWLVTIATLPICVLVGWGMTKLIEEPLTRYGRTWRWSSSPAETHISLLEQPVA
jgi:peptidoglycan/LPS O-acetylase OafA/YrhL